LTVSRNCRDASGAASMEAGTVMFDIRPVSLGPVRGNPRGDRRSLAGLPLFVLQQRIGFRINARCHPERRSGVPPALMSSSQAVPHGATGLPRLHGTRPVLKFVNSGRVAEGSLFSTGPPPRKGCPALFAAHYPRGNRSLSFPRQDQTHQRDAGIRPQ
jgi:hypothetical protein